MPTTFLAVEGRLESASSTSTLISDAERGDRVAAEALFSKLYAELHRPAKRELTLQGVPVSLSATTLLHQAYIEMAEQDKAAFPDRARFMGYTARVMRGVIIDHARNRCRPTRGGQCEITSLGSGIVDVADHHELIEISEALVELSKAEPLPSELVDLKFFACLPSPKGHEGYLRAHDTTTVGKSTHLSSPLDALSSRLRSLCRH